MQGYVYSTFLKAYNPQRDVSERPDDFDNLSLFVSGSRSSSLYSFNQQGEPESTQEQLDIAEEQHVRQLIANKVFIGKCSGPVYEESGLHQPRHSWCLTFTSLVLHWSYKANVANKLLKHKLAVCRLRHEPEIGRAHV